MTSRKEVEILDKRCPSCETKLVKTVDENDEFDGHVTCPNVDCPRGWLLTASYYVGACKEKEDTSKMLEMTTGNARDVVWD